MKISNPKPSFTGEEPSTEVHHPTSDPRAYPEAHESCVGAFKLPLRTAFCFVDAKFSCCSPPLRDNLALKIHNIKRKRKIALKN
jgi:hypothetical protein